MIKIRPIEPRDARDCYEIRIMEGVRETTLGLSSMRLGATEEFCSIQDPDGHVFVAEMDGKVVGTAGLHVNKSLRKRHGAFLGIMVHRDYQGKGVGSKLMEAMVDLADNWLKLVRIELTVFCDNDNAMKLYENHGFVVEGVQKYAAVKDGAYADITMMARYNLK
ncbi:MAG: GNAT family N-acetyltransferase [Clostridia bacterium]|nr:GNAT family N-acetyltransferase [Clostridia bacterium]